MGDDDKPFACTEPGCGMRFANEDHLSVHKMKHEMSLALNTAGTKSTNLFFVDQTPTPTKFIKNCEEIGLFTELSKNPFEEAFKKASDQLHPGHGDTEVSSPLPGPSTSREDASEGAIPRAVRASQRKLPSRAVEPSFIPLPGPGDDSLEEPSVSTDSTQSAQVTQPVVPTSQSQTLDADALPPNVLVPASQPSSTTGDEDVTIVSTSFPANSATTVKHSDASLHVDKQVTGAAVSPTITIPAVSLAKQPQYVMQVVLQLPTGQLSIPVQIPTAVTTQAVPIPAVVPQGAPAAAPAKAPTPTQQTQQNIVSTSAAPNSTAHISTKQKLKAALTQQSVLNSNMQIMSEAVERVTSVDRVVTQHGPVLTATSPINPVVLHTGTPSPQSECSSANQPSSPELKTMNADSSGLVSIKRARSSSDDVDPDEKRKRFLERNRAAAARCRTKRKNWINSLEGKAEELQQTNTKLQNEVRTLRNEVAQLKTLLLAHKDCPITLAQRSAGQLAFQTVPAVDTAAGGGQSTTGTTVITVPAATGADTAVTQTAAPTVVTLTRSNISQAIPK